MKKLFTLMLLCTAISLCFMSCSNEEEEETLSGTTWTASYLDHSILVIKFTSSTEFSEYMADLQGNVMSTGVDYGTYIFDGSNVIFENQTSSSPFDYAIINGDVLSLTYKSGYKRTFLKK